MLSEHFNVFLSEGEAERIRDRRDLAGEISRTHMIKIDGGIEHIAAFLADRQGDAEACLFASDVAAARKHDDMATMLKAKAQEIKLRGRAGIPQGSRPSRDGRTGL